MGVTTKAVKQFAARFQRFQEMEVVNGSSGTVRFFSIAREYQGRPAIAFDHASGGNSDYTAMPAFAVDDKAVRLAQLGSSRDPVLDLLQDLSFLLLALAIQEREPFRDLPGTLRILLAEQFD